MNALEEIFGVAVVDAVRDTVDALPAAKDGGAMRTSTRVAATITVGLALTLSACSTNGGDEPAPAGEATTSESETPTDDATSGATERHASQSSRSWVPCHRRC